MTCKALILGANGRFGRHASAALIGAGWDVRHFDRKTGSLSEAASGVEVIVNAWNVPYSQWAKTLPGLTQQVTAAAQTSGAAVVIPGNLYVYGSDLPNTLSADTPHRATHPLGRLRRDMERAYGEAGVKTVILRAGDFIDTRPSGNWFDRVIVAKLAKGRISYPGPLDRAHAWAFLPDLSEAFARVLEHLPDLPQVSDLLFDGYTMSGRDLAEALGAALGCPIEAREMSWRPIHLARPFWAEAKHLLEMRYLWQRPHRIDGADLQARIGEIPRTPLDKALRAATAALRQ